MAGVLKKEDFKATEDSNNVAIDNLYFAGNASGHKLDLAVVFDDTGSMQPEIDVMKSKVKDLTDKIKVSGLDANYSLISFKDGVSIRTKWTNDPVVFEKNIDSLHADSGGDEPEDSLDAIEAVLSMGFRPTAQKIILAITDAHAHDKDDGSGFSKYTKEQVEKDLKDQGVIFIPISPAFKEPNVHVDLKSIANDTQSKWINMGSADFSIILAQFKGIITGTYVVEYTSPDQTSVGNRSVTITANLPGCVVGNDSISYNKPENAAKPNAPPFLNSLIFDKTSPQDAGTAINWTANAVDPDGDLVLYKFFLDGRPMTPWEEDKTWIWVPGQAGHYQVEVQVRDAKHAGPDEQDDRRAESFTINEPKPAASKNQPPVVDDLSPVQGKAKEITWTANATDSDGDRILYRYVLNNKSMTDWIDKNKWILNDTEANAGENRVEVQIKDGKHAGLDGYDDAKSVKFILSSMKLMTQTWKKTFGGPDTDEGYSVQQTSDGGYIIVGNIVGNKSTKVWLIKTNSQGDEEWNRTFNGKIGEFIQQTGDGGYLVMALSEGHPLIIKTDSTGNKQDETILSHINDVGPGQPTNDGGYIFIGSTSSYGNGMTDILLVKTDINGNVLWDRTFGGSQIDEGNCIEQTKDGGYIIGGLTFPSLRDEDQRGWLIKTDAKGNEIWTKTLSYGQGPIVSVQQTTDGGYIIASSNFSIGSGRLLSSKGLVMKIDLQGNEEWARTFNGNFKSIQQTSDGGYIVAGSFSYNSYLMKIDSQGRLEWERTLTHGGPLTSSGLDEAVSVRQTSDGGYMITGSIGHRAIEGPDSYGSYTVGGDDVFLIKTDPNGNI
ncbi:MAG: VWA domain-containing protein [Methanotrichaceae archaeon]